jgi:very-short-patch-repair endonuclease
MVLVRPLDADLRHLPSEGWDEGDARPGPARAVSELAARQHGVVSARQLADLGLSSSTVARWTAAGRLLRLHRGVYAVGHAALTADGRRLASVLAAGPVAFLSHRSAGELWGVMRWSGARHEVTVPGAGGRRRRRELRVHRHRLDPADRTIVDGVPVTTLARTLLDLAEVLPPARLARVIEEAERLGLLDLHALHDVMARARGRRGLRALRAALALYRPQRAVPRSGLERAALELIRDHGLPEPSANLWLHGYEVDLLWPDHGVIVELDTTAFHATTAAFERDRRRDADLQARGFRVLRFTDRRISEDAPGVAATIAAALGRASPSSHPSEET